MSPATVASWRDLAVDRQPQPQVAEALQVAGVEQHQPGPDGREGGVGLRLVELRLGQLQVARRDVVGDDQPGDVVLDVVGGDVGADGQRPADHEADLGFVVQEAHAVRTHDVVVGTADGPRRLAEERQRDGRRVEPGIRGVGAVVGHLCDDAARRGDRGEQRQLLHGDRLVAGVGDRAAVGEQLGGGGRRGRDPGGTGGLEDPPGVGGAHDRGAHELATFSRPRRRRDVELVVLAQRAGDGPQLLGEVAGALLEEVRGRRRPPLGEVARRHRRPAGLEGRVEVVAVGVVLDQEAVGVAPVVEDLAALDVAADAPASAGSRARAGTRRPRRARRGRRPGRPSARSGWRGPAPSPACGGRPAWSRGRSG